MTHRRTYNFFKLYVSGYLAYKLTSFLFDSFADAESMENEMNEAFKENNKDIGFEERGETSNEDKLGDIEGEMEDASNEESKVDIARGIEKTSFEDSEVMAEEMDGKFDEDGRYITNDRRDERFNEDNEGSAEYKMDGSSEEDKIPEEDIEYVTNGSMDETINEHRHGPIDEDLEDGYALGNVLSFLTS